MGRNSKSYNVRAVERAMQILSSFDGEHAELGVSEVAQVTGLHKATAHRIIMTLLNGGFLERTPDGEGFRLGPRVAALGREALRFARRAPDVRGVALPYMQQLVDRFQETCTLSVFDRGQVVLLEIVHSRHALTIADRVGSSLPAHCTASGKVLLAFLPPVALEPILNAPLAAYTEKTITSPARLREEFKIVRQRGYALNDEEFEVGLRAVSVPIWDVDGNLIAMLSMPGPTNRITPERIPEIVQALVEAAEAVSEHVSRG